MREGFEVAHVEPGWRNPFTCSKCRAPSFDHVVRPPGADRRPTYLCRNGERAMVEILLPIGIKEIAAPSSKVATENQGPKA